MAAPARTTTTASAHAPGPAGSGRSGPAARSRLHSGWARWTRAVTARSRVPPRRPCRASMHSLVGLFADRSSCTVLAGRVAGLPPGRQRRARPPHARSSTEPDHPHRHRRAHLERRQRQGHAVAVVVPARRVDGRGVGALGLHQHLPGRRVAQPVGRRPRRRPGPGQERRPQDHRPVPADPGRRQRGRARLGRLRRGRGRPEVRLDAWALLGEQLASNKQCIQAVGPGAGLGAAYQLRRGPPVCRVRRLRQLTGLLTGCRVTLVDVGSLRDPDDLARQRGQVHGAAAGPSRPRRSTSGSARCSRPRPSGSDLVVASLSDAGQQRAAAAGRRQGPAASAPARSTPPRPGRTGWCSRPT